MPRIIKKPGTGEGLLTKKGQGGVDSRVVGSISDLNRSQRGGVESTSCRVKVKLTPGRLLWLREKEFAMKSRSLSPMSRRGKEEEHGIEWA